MSAHTRQTQRGFTLTEILVTTAIFAIIMLAALAVYDRSNRVFKTSTEAADMQQSTRIGFDKLVSDLRMAGFDYSRGGVPTQSWQAPQPDEQIEYAGPTAVVFRSNFNYNVPTTPDNGREVAYTPVNVDGKAIFPYVTTSNDEIIAYVLRSTTASANTNSISVWVDDYQPRSVFPSNIQPAPAAANPARVEERVTFTGIDTTNNNPPYTLYRVSVADVRNGSLGTPVAENIRSLNFQYYSDFNGSTLLKNADGTDILNGRNAGGGTFAAANTGAIGGDGQYDPGNIGSTTNFVDRSQRSTIASIRVSLVGMNATPDLQGYTNPTETIASIQKYRQYSLSSLVSPRNLGMTGFPEPNYNAPSPPTITGVCIGHCGAPVIYWDPPASGEVFSYRVEWDTNQQGAFAPPTGGGIDITDPSARSAVIADDGTIDPDVTRYFRMMALNDNGQSYPSALWQSNAKNKTRPSAPTSFQGTTGQPNRIPLQWVSPSTNEAPQNQLQCDSAAGSPSAGANIPSGEIIKYRVYRGTTATFDPNAGEGVRTLSFDSASQPPVVPPGSTVNWVGSGATSNYPAANCVDYYYRVQALDRCYKQPTWNSPTDANGLNSMSNFTPTVGSAAAGPFRSTATAAPVVPPTAALDTTPLSNGCPDPQNLTSPFCRATLSWTKTLSDTAGNRIGIDSYVISRAFRVQVAPPTPPNPYLPDPAFGTAGSLEVNCPTGTCASGFSQTDPASPNTFTDFPRAVDTNGFVLEYRYTIAAKNCSFYSGNAPNSITEASLPPNPQVDFPGCTTNPTISLQGQTSGTGLSPLSPAVMNAGDTITTVPNPSPGWTVDSVHYDVSLWPQGTPVGSTVQINTPPYVFAWTDQIDLQVYQVRVTIFSHDASGTPCTEVRVRYVQDQQAAGCFFANTVPPNRQVSGHGSNPETDTVTLTLTNTGTEPIKFNSAVTTPILGSIFRGDIAFTWHSPDLPNHTDLQLTDVVYNMNAQTAQSGTWGSSPAIAAYSFTDSICAYGINCTAAGSGTLTTTRNVPLTMPDLLPGNSVTIRLSFKFDSRSGRPSLPINPSAITKTCVSYRILSEPTVTKKCNLVGQAGSTLNPNNCD